MRKQRNVIMDCINKASQLHQDFWFSYYRQGYYFSFGYFAFTRKTEYEKSFVKNLAEVHLAEHCLS